jgi:hypothetical protein
VVAAGSAVTALLLATVWLVLPFVHHWSTRAAQLAATRERWARLTTVVARTGQLRQMLDAARQAATSDQDQLVAGATPALAASTLQELLQRDASQSAVQLERVDAAGDPHPDKPGLLAVPVQLQARGDLFGLVDFLTLLEHGSPLVVVDEMTIDAGQDADEGPVTTEAVNAPRQTLTWTLRLHGLYEASRDGSP